MLTSSNNIYEQPVLITVSLPIFKSIRNGLKLSPHIQSLSLKIDGKELSCVLDELAVFSLIGILYQLTPKGVEEAMKSQGDKSKEDSLVENQPDKQNQPVSESVPAQDSEGESL